MVAVARRILFAGGIFSLVGVVGCDSSQPPVVTPCIRAAAPLRTLTELRTAFSHQTPSSAFSGSDRSLIRLTIDVQRAKPALRLEAAPSSASAAQLVLSLTNVPGVSTDDPSRPSASMPLSDWTTINAVVDALSPLAVAARSERDFYAACLAAADAPGFSPGILRLSDDVSLNSFRLPPVFDALISRRAAPTGHPLDLALADTPGVLAFFAARAFESDDVVLTRDGRFAVINDPESTTGDRLLVNSVGRISGISSIPETAARLRIDAEGSVFAVFILLDAGETADGTPEMIEREEPLGALPVVVFSLDKPLPLKGDGRRFVVVGQDSPSATTLKAARIQALPGHLNVFSSEPSCADRRAAFAAFSDVLERALNLLDVCRLTQLLTADQPNETARLAEQIKQSVKTAVDEQTRELKMIKLTDPASGPRTLRLSGRLEKTREFFAASRLKDRATMASGTLTVRFENAQEGIDALSECLTILKNILTVHQQNIQNMYVGAYAARELKIEAQSDVGGGSITGVSFSIVPRQTPHKWVKPESPTYPGIDETDPDKRVKLPNVDLDSERTAYRSAHDEYLLLQDTLKNISGGWTLMDVPAVPEAPVKPNGL